MTHVPLTLAAARLARCPACQSFDVAREAGTAGAGPTDNCKRCGSRWPHKPGSLTAEQYMTTEPAAIAALSAGSEPYILQLDGTGEGTPLPMGLERLPTHDAAGVPIHYRRVLIAQCKPFVHRGTGESHVITRQRADEWIRNHLALSAAGVVPFVPGEHRDGFNAADNFGYVVRLEREGDNVYAVLALHGDEALKVAARNGRSIYIVRNAKDDAGHEYAGEALHHVALVPNPALRNLGGMVKIAASAGAPAVDVPVYELPTANNPAARRPKLRSHKMKPELAQQVREKLGLGADVPDDQLDDACATKALALSATAATVPTLTGELTTVKQERDTLKTDLATAQDAVKAKADEVLALSAANKPAPEPDALSLALITRSFKTDRDSVIASGVVSEAGMKEIDGLLFNAGKPTGAALALSAGATDPFYSRLCEILRRNPGIQTGTGVKRGTPAEPATAALAASADANAEKPMTDERRRALLGSIDLEPITPAK